LAGTLFGGDNGNVVEAFPLPYLPPGQTVTAASISFYLATNTSQGNPNYNLDLYGLNRVSTTSSAPLITDWYVGANDTTPGNVQIKTGFITPSTTVNQAVTYTDTGAALTKFINTQYANAAFSGMSLNSTSRYIFFRLNANSNVTNNGFSNYTIASARNPTRSMHPLLSLTLSGGTPSAVNGLLQFSFDLPENAVTSAGVYNTSGVLIRTLWNNVQFNQGMNYGVWDGKNDAGVAQAAGSSYQIQLIYHNVQYVWQGMIGNTSASQTGANVYKAFGKIHDMAFDSGNGYYSVAYNELAAPFHTFTIGTPQVPSAVNLGYNFSDCNACLYYVATDGTRTYWAKTYGGISAADTYVIAITNSNSTTGGAAFYTFPKGTSLSGMAYQNYPSCTDFDSTANQANPPSGLAVQKSGSYLFVSHSNLNVVRVFDKVQGNLLGSFTVQNPGRLAVTKNGDVWVISNGTTPTVYRYTFTAGSTTTNGKATLDEAITGFSAPAGLGVSPDDTLLLVTDGGSSQQIKAYDNAPGYPASTSTPLWTYGTLGGMPVNGPTISTSSFDFNVQRANFNDFSNEAFISFQPDGTLWLEDGGNGRVLHYSINGTTLNYIEQIAYTDASYRSTVDLTNATRVFNTFMEYSVDYSLPLGGTNGSWTMTKNWAVGLPNDANHCYFGGNNGLTNVVTLSNGHTYGFLFNYVNNSSDLYELPASGPLRFTGYTFVNATTPLIYADGTLRYNVTNSGQTSLTCYSQPLTGFDAQNNPVWGSPATIASVALNSTTDPIPWSAFPMRTEITASGIVVDFDGNQAQSGYHLGGIPLGGTTWKWEASPSVNGPPWFPQNGAFDIGNGVQYAGNYAMALGRDIIYGYHGELWCSGEASQWVDYYDNGLMVGRFGTYGDAEISSVAIDGFAGNSFSPTLVQAADGNTYLYHNDESNHGGTLRWLISGWNNITTLEATSTLGSVVSLNATTGPTVSLTSPTPGATYSNGENLTISAQATSSGASIASVQFLDGTTSLGTVSVAPFTLNYSGLAAGTHVLTAKATDSSGLSATSSPVTITIGGDGTSAPPPAPTALSSSAVASNSVTLNWTEPTIGTTSSTIGQIISLEFSVAGTSGALASTAVAGAPNYTADNFNVMGQTGTSQLTFMNLLNNAGTTVPNIGLYLAMGPSNSTNSTQSLTGTAQKLFSGEVQSYNSTTGLSISNIPYANYDVVVYSLPPNISTGSQSTSVTVNNYTTSSTVQQSFTTLPTGYTVTTVPFGSNSSVTNMNTVVVQGIASGLVEVQGANIAGIQIVERPYDQGTPTSYNIQRATGTSGDFATVGTASGTVLTFTDTSSLNASTTYQYRIQAVNSFGSSAYSNIITVTTPASTTPTATSFGDWQSQYFTTEQLADPTISGPTADPYGSGVPNLLAYALQLNPATAQLSNVPSPTIVNGVLTVTYFIPASIKDISYIVEVSTDLVNWNSGTGYTNVVSDVTAANGQTVTVQDALPASTPKVFMRLRVTQNQ